MSQKHKKSPATVFVDLDKLVEDSGVVIKKQGKEHRMRLISVRDYIANIQRIEEFKRNGTIENEMGFIVETLAQAFPTLREEDFYNLSLPQLQAIYRAFEDFAQNGANGTDAETSESDPQPASE